MALVSSNGSRSRDQLLQAFAAGGESTEPHADGSQAGGDARADNDIQQESPDGANQRPQGRRRGHKHGAGRDPPETKDQHRDRDLQQLVEATAKLTLKLADAQQVLLQDCGFTWFVSTEPGGILPTMFGVSAEWKKLKESSPHLSKSPLPTLMMTCILEELVARMQRTVAEESMQKAALQAGWCTEAGGWAYKQWDLIKKELVDTKEAPLTLTALETIVKEIQTDIREPGNLHKFQASQPLSEDMEMMAEHREVCFTIQVSVRATGERLYREADFDKKGDTGRGRPSIWTDCYGVSLALNVAQRGQHLLHKCLGSYYLLDARTYRLSGDVLGLGATCLACHFGAAQGRCSPQIDSMEFSDAGLVARRTAARYLRILFASAVQDADIAVPGDMERQIRGGRAHLHTRLWRMLRFSFTDARCSDRWTVKLARPRQCLDGAGVYTCFEVGTPVAGDSAQPFSSAHCFRRDLQGENGT